MALVAAAVVPHSPLLLLTIAKNHFERSAQTRAALVDVGQEIYAAQPDTIVVITPHGGLIDQAFVIEQNDRMIGTLREFGDVQTSLELPGAIGLAHRFKAAAEDAGLPIVLQSQVGLDYGVTVPWLCLWPKPVPWRVMVLSVGPGRSDQLIQTGQLLRDFFQAQSDRVAVLASGDTERRLPGASDADRRPTVYERALSEAITHLDVSRLPDGARTSACLDAPATILLSALQGLAKKSTIRSFEVPLSVGQLVATVTFA